MYVVHKLVDFFFKMLRRPYLTLRVQDLCIMGVFPPHYHYLIATVMSFHSQQWVTAIHTPVQQLLRIS